MPDARRAARVDPPPGRAPVAAVARRGDSAFRLLWIGQSVSLAGTYVDDVATKLLAAAVLSATPFQLGLLTAAQTAAFLLFGLPAGVFVDRMRRRPVLVVCDLARALLLATIPLLWWLGGLTFAYLVTVIFLVGVGDVVFQVAYQSILPALVARDELAAANGKLESSRSAAAAAGPAAGGAVAQAIGPAPAVGLDALSYLVSSSLFWRMRVDEAPATASTRRPVRAEIAEGLRFVLGHRVLRALTLAATTYNFSYGILNPLVVVLLVTELSLPGATVGALLACAGIGGVAGAVAASRFVARWGMARSTCIAEAVSGPACLVLVWTSDGAGVWPFAAGYLVLHLFLSVFNVASVSFRQALCPDHLLGRMNASVRFLMWGALPLGGLTGGVLATALGVRAGIALAACGFGLAAAILFVSPLWRMRDAPVEELEDVR